MRRCLRCNTEMIENCSIKVQNSAYGIDLATDERRLFNKRIGKPQVAICPACGEVSIYIENPKALNETL
jgi:transcription elongation factor Elf1